MLDLDTIKQLLSDRNLAEVARRTGLSEFTVGRYARGEVKEPPVSTVRTLSDYLTGKVAREESDG